ncbi:MAG: GNAT family N-acetyltransferase, partial [Bacteroidota bacterium]
SLSPAYWHQGLASEAATLLIDYAFGELGFPEVRASTDAPNTHSLRLLDRLEFTVSHRAEASGLDTVFYVRPNPDATATRRT